MIRNLIIILVKIIAICSTHTDTQRYSNDIRLYETKTNGSYSQQLHLPSWKSNIDYLKTSGRYRRLYDAV